MLMAGSSLHMACTNGSARSSEVHIHRVQATKRFMKPCDERPSVPEIHRKGHTVMCSDLPASMASTPSSATCSRLSCWGLRAAHCFGLRHERLQSEDKRIVRA